MKIQITWLQTNTIQTKRLINHCRADITGEFFTMNSPIYKAIEDNSFCLKLGYGEHHFTIKEL